MVGNQSRCRIEICGKSFESTDLGESVSDIIRGEKRENMCMVQALAKILGMEPEALLNEMYIELDLWKQHLGPATLMMSPQEVVIRRMIHDVSRCKHF